MLKCWLQLALARGQGFERFIVGAGVVVGAQGLDSDVGGAGCVVGREARANPRGVAPCDHRVNQAIAEAAGQVAVVEAETS